MATPPPIDASACGRGGAMSHLPVGRRSGAGVSQRRRARRVVARLAVGLAFAVTVAAPAHAQTKSPPPRPQGPCDIYAAAGTPCVAAHSTTRALYAAYSGSLYQVRRSSDNTTRDIGVLSTGGVANAATQDSFCSGTTCVITIIYDQSGRGNHL